MSERFEGIFQLEPRTLRAVEDLREKLRARSSSEVIRNALSLLKIAVDNADPESLVIVLQTKEGKFITVDLKANN